MHHVLPFDLEQRAWHAGHGGNGPRRLKSARHSLPIKWRLLWKPSVASLPQDETMLIFTRTFEQRKYYLQDHPARRSTFLLGTERISFPGPSAARYSWRSSALVRFAGIRYFAATIGSPKIFFQLLTRNRASHGEQSSAFLTWKELSTSLKTV